MIKRRAETLPRLECAVGTIRPLPHLVQPALHLRRKNYRMRQCFSAPFPCFKLRYNRHLVPMSSVTALGAGSIHDVNNEHGDGPKTNLGLGSNGKMVTVGTAGAIDGGKCEQKSGSSSRASNRWNKRQSALS